MYIYLQFIVILSKSLKLFRSPDQILNWQVIEHNDGVCNLWKCSLFYDQKNYTSTNFYKSKKLAREELSTAILQDLSPVINIFPEIFMSINL